MSSELVDELAELLFVDVEMALGGGDELCFDGGGEVEEFVVVGVEPVIGVGGFAPEVEDIVVDGDAEFFVGFGEVEALGEDMFEMGAVFGDGVGDGAELLGAAFVVGFEFGDDEVLVFVVVVEGFDACGEGFGSLCLGVVEEGVEGGVDDGGVNDVRFGFVGEVVFPVLAGGFVDAEGAFEVGFFDGLVPVAEASGGDTGDVFEFFVGFVCMVSIIASGLEGAVPNGMMVGMFECNTCGEAGVTLEIAFQGVPSCWTVSVEKMLGFGGVGMAGKKWRIETRNRLRLVLCVSHPKVTSQWCI